MQSTELSSWASSMVGREIHTYIHTRAYDSSTQPSIHITSFLWWQTAPQPFVIITEPFQLKDKIFVLPYSCLLSGRWPWESYSSMGGLGEGRGEPTHPCPQVFSLEVIVFSSFWEAKARQWSCPEQDGSSFQFSLHCATGVVWFFFFSLGNADSLFLCRDWFIVLI